MDTLVVGDVHGCAAELQALVAAARAVDEALRVVLVGDLFTKGPDPVGVWTQIREGGWDSVLGNHDDRLLRIQEGRRPGDAHGQSCVRQLESRAPGAMPWLRERPLFLDVGRFTVVHAGLHPSGELAATTREMALVMRRWPLKVGMLWHRVYTGERRVICGHDAIRGLVRVERDGQPHIVGIDTGCVYGKRLTGYLIGRDQQLSVPARRSYWPKMVKVTQVG